jgi:hypothetical protein
MDFRPVGPGESEEPDGDNYATEKGRLKPDFGRGAATGYSDTGIALLFDYRIVNYSDKYSDSSTNKYKAADTTTLSVDFL